MKQMTGLITEASIESDQMSGSDLKFFKTTSGRHKMVKQLDFHEREKKKRQALFLKNNPTFRIKKIHASKANLDKNSLYIHKTITMRDSGRSSFHSLNTKVDKSSKFLNIGTVKTNSELDENFTKRSGTVISDRPARLSIKREVKSDDSLMTESDLASPVLPKPEK